MNIYLKTLIATLVMGISMTNIAMETTLFGQKRPANIAFETIADAVVKRQRKDEPAIHLDQAQIAPALTALEFPANLNHLIKELEDLIKTTPIQALPKMDNSEKITVQVNIQNNEKSHQCTYCNKSFARKDYLIKHTHTHNDQKIKCKYENCTMTFKCNDYLKAHIYRMHKHYGHKEVII
jgi:hypothetical protein